MNYSDIISWVAGLLQLSVACYALRLNRLFATARVGWSLFCAFTLLALLHLMQSGQVFKAISEFGMKVDVIYGLISLLLLIGMAHMESVFKEKREIVELKRVTHKLEAEIIKRKRIEVQMKKTYEDMLSVSRQAGMSEVATNVLHNVGNVLNSVNVSASLVSDHLLQSRVTNVARVAALMREHASDLGDFMTRDPKGQQLPSYLTQLADHLAKEQTLLLDEIGFVKKKVEHIRDIVAMQQNYAVVVGLTETVKVTDLVEDALMMNADALARYDVQIVREYDPHVPEITVEKHKVLQVLINLVRNAKHACDESGRKDKRLVVHVKNGDGRVRIVVKDNGAGISAENFPKIFNNGFTTRKGGHGFGLHSGALAAKAMGGVIHAHSDGPGKGATFTLELPVEPARKTGNTEIVRKRSA